MADEANDSVGDHEQLITLADAAELSGLSRSHLRLLVRQGKVWGTKLGRDWLTTEAAVQRYLSNYLYWSRNL